MKNAFSSLIDRRDTAKEGASGLKKGQQKWV